MGAASKDPSPAREHPPAKAQVASQEADETMLMDEILAMSEEPTTRPAVVHTPIRADAPPKQKQQSSDKESNRAPRLQTKGLQKEVLDARHSSKRPMAASPRLLSPLALGLSVTPAPYRASSPLPRPKEPSPSCLARTPRFLVPQPEPEPEPEPKP